jgi:hypothetical protein
VFEHCTIPFLSEASCKTCGCEQDLSGKPLLPGIEMPVWYGKPALAGFAYQKVVSTTFSFSQVGDNSCLHPNLWHRRCFTKDTSHRDISLLYLVGDNLTFLPNAAAGSNLVVLARTEALQNSRTGVLASCELRKANYSCRATYF